MDNIRESREFLKKLFCGDDFETERGGVCLKNLGVIEGRSSSASLANPLRVSRQVTTENRFFILYLHDLTLIIPSELHSAKSMSTAYIIDKVAKQTNLNIDIKLKIGTYKLDKKRTNT